MSQDLKGAGLLMMAIIYTLNRGIGVADPSILVRGPSADFPVRAGHCKSKTIDRLASALRGSVVSSLTGNRVFPAFAKLILSRNIKQQRPRTRVESLRSARKTGTNEWPTKSGRRDNTLTRTESQRIQVESSSARDTVGRGFLGAYKCSAARTAVVLRG